MKTVRKNILQYLVAVFSVPKHFSNQLYFSLSALKLSWVSSLISVHENSFFILVLIIYIYFASSHFSDYAALFL